MSNREGEIIDSVTNVAFEDGLKLGLKAKVASKCYKFTIILWVAWFITSLYFIIYSFSFEEVPDDQEHALDYGRLNTNTIKIFKTKNLVCFQAFCFGF